MTKLLIITTIQRTLRDFLLPYGDYFRSLGWQVDAMSNIRDPFPVAEEHFDHFWPVDWGRNPLDLHNFIHTPKKIREIVQREGYDIVHVHTPVAAFITRFALRKMRAAGKVKVIYTAHGFHFYKGNLKIKNSLFIVLEKLAGQWTDHLIVMNQEDYDSALKYGIAKKDNLTLMPGIGVDLSLYTHNPQIQNQKENIRKEIGISSEAVVILIVAEFIPRKRHSDALKTLAIANNLEYHMVFAGSGPLSEKIKNEAIHFGLEKQTHFLGHRKDIPRLITAANALLLISQQEGLPRSIMESMAMGVPVIGTDIRGTRDLLAENCGMLVPLGDIQKIAEKIDFVAHPTQELQKIIDNAANKIKKYDIKILLKKQLELYSRMLRR